MLELRLKPLTGNMPSDEEEERALKEIRAAYEEYERLLEKLENLKSKYGQTICKQPIAISYEDVKQAEDELKISISKFDELTNKNPYTWNKEFWNIINREKKRFTV
jgi:hypothetical protein